MWYVFARSGTQCFVSICQNISFLVFEAAVIVTVGCSLSGGCEGADVRAGRSEWGRSGCSFVRRVGEGDFPR